MLMIWILVSLALSDTFQQFLRRHEHAVGQEDGPPACFDTSLSACLAVFDASGEPKEATQDEFCACMAAQDQNCVLYTFQDSDGSIDVTVAMQSGLMCSQTSSYSWSFTDSSDSYPDSYPDDSYSYPKKYYDGSMYDGSMDDTSMVDLTSKDDVDCSSHADCGGDTPFCYDGICDKCDQCQNCWDGVDGTCGPCGRTTKGDTCGMKECILESDYRGAYGDCFQFESEKYAPFCSTDSMIMKDDGIEETVYASEACSQCGMCTSRTQALVVEPAGSPFCGDKVDEEFVPLCGACLYSSQCLGHQASFNSDNMWHEIYCCPNTKICMNKGMCTMDDIREHPNYLADSSWNPSYASCGNTMENPGCSERHAAYPNECTCEDSNFPLNWVECPIAAESASFALMLTKVQGDFLINGLAMVGFVALVYGGVQFFKSQKKYQTVSFDTEDL